MRKSTPKLYERNTEMPSSLEIAREIVQYFTGIPKEPSSALLKLLEDYKNSHECKPMVIQYEAGTPPQQYQISVCSVCGKVLSGV